MRNPQVLFAKVGWDQGFGFDDLILICLVMLSVSSVVMGKKNPIKKLQER